MPNEILSLAVTFVSCELTILINGLPVVREATPSPLQQQHPVNQYLVKGTNQLTLRVAPAKMHDLLDIGGARVEGTLKVFQEGQIVTPEDGKSLDLTRQQEGGVPHASPVFDITRALAQHLDKSKVLEINYTFDCEITDFSARLKASPVITDMAAVRAYAVKLRDILKNQNLNALMNELAPKISDQAKAYYQAENPFREMFRQTFQSGYIQKPFHTDWKPEDVEIISWAGGRFMELRVAGNSILDNVRDEKNGWISMPCIVSLVEGELKVTR